MTIKVSCTVSDRSVYSRLTANNECTAVWYGAGVRSSIRPVRSLLTVVFIYVFQLLVLSTTIGRRSLPAPASFVCNTLPAHLQSSPSISTLRQRLKTFLSQQSFPVAIM